ncbi:uncharacterized protein LOC6579911 [Drosophila mojavensis]|uniref:Uncharacterized protein, isoform A n=1 Tax=Drosophila mojavensis TaxID=7230 RepID=B4KUC3_DROMO|nr:uncharacterized protein LOC6579911 [Drosophila mojavensis]XP_015019466.1 uncharacterized protein LOC6579911 [Drosophila mojavensis]EDW09719.1 uncharacterized protein Dmoj_GI20655, isoform A [Drosophila mojavensis]KRG04862.1 uncharacterized protein Dmoj_GI20655, isoform B [Drosophila mojavensis]
MNNFSGREKYLISNTLNCLPIILQGRAVLIDLRNETSVAGIISIADGHMTCELTDAVFIDRNGKCHAFDNFLIRNRMIRLLHVPADLDIKHELSQLQRRPANRNKTKTKRTFKQKRAEERHKETLQIIKTQKVADKPQET